MCGIAGLVDKGHKSMQSSIEAMLKCIEHRGPDDVGKWMDARVSLGHRRLSILDLSPRGKQPMVYDGRYVLVFNGEIYNYIELREDLKQKGYKFRTESDSEVIPAAYDCWGESCQERLNGMWAFALYDIKEQILFCSRDRFGIKPLYYTQTKNYFAFGSEIKQLLALMDDQPKVNHVALEVFLAVGYLDYSEETMFQEIWQLRGGHCLTYFLGTHQYVVRRWFDILNISEQSMTDDDAIRQFRQLFDDAIDRHLRADVEIGSCLSGGLDSSAIVCSVNHKFQDSPRQSRQYTISSCFKDEKFDEREYISSVTEACQNLDSTEVFPEMDALLKQLRDMVWHMDEPFGSSSVYAQWEVYRRARKLGLKVMLDGQGADEQLAGYSDFYKLLFVVLFRHGHWLQLAHELKRYYNIRAVHETRSQIHFLLVSIVEAILPIRMQNWLFRFYQKRDSTRNWVCLSEQGLNKICQIKQRYAKRNPRRYIRTFMEVGMSELLHYEDRSSMAFSVEARVPFLDAELVKGLMRMPLTMKIRDGKTKWVMREALKDVLPEKIVSRYGKMGFVTPENEWFMNHRCELEPILREAATTLSSFIDEKKFLQWLNKGQAIEAGDFRIWRVLCAAEWIKTFHVKKD